MGDMDLCPSVVDYFCVEVSRISETLPVVRLGGCMIVDGGERTTFGTGAVREIDETKGRCDLVYNYVFGQILDDSIPIKIESFVRTGNRNDILDVICLFMDKYYASRYDAYLDLSKHYAEGAKKYSDRNMEKGIPHHSFIDSAMRHYAKFMRGDSDEPHDRAFLWNLFTLLYMTDAHPELNDLPYKGEGGINA